MEDFKSIVIELIRDVKSRKFLLVVGFGALVIYNHINAIGISVSELLMILGAVGGYLLVEGLADMMSRPEQVKAEEVKKIGDQITADVTQNLSDQSEVGE